MNYRHRDVEFIKFDEYRYLAIACDSCGAIGLKENDIVDVPYSITGKYTARVCLMEILSIGAKPISITATICNELNPTGEEILTGVKDEISKLGFNIPITISTEKNMKTSMTALGITAIGIVDKDSIMVDNIYANSYIYSIGIPCIGNEVLENQDFLCNIEILKKVLKLQSIKEIIPVGSSGIKGELEKLCRYQDIEIQYENDIKIDIYKSAGPCTVMIAISKNKIDNKLSVPINIIGKII